MPKIIRHSKRSFLKVDNFRFNTNNSLVKLNKTVSTDRWYLSTFFLLLDSSCLASKPFAAIWSTTTGPILSLPSRQYQTRNRCRHVLTMTTTTIPKWHRLPQTITAVFLPHNWDNADSSTIPRYKSHQYGLVESIPFFV
jgi:hypothetical protein